MASSVIGALRVTLGLDSAQFTTGVRKARGQLGPLQKSMGTLAGAARSLGAALGVASAGLAGRKFLALADESKQLTAQLKLATAQFGSFAKAQEDVRRIAAQTRTGLTETAALYGTLQRNSRELGIEQQEAARATETITKAFKISGATAAEAAGGLRQFLQGIQSGTLRGEELNSVLENAPRLARILADGLGVTIGQLRAMGQAGELTGRQVLDALRGAADQIDKEFAELPKTFDEAMTTVHNAAVITFGAFDRGGQISTTIANFITGATGGFADLEKQAFDTGLSIRAGFSGLEAVFRPLINSVKALGDAFGYSQGEAITLRQEISGLLGVYDRLANMFVLFDGDKPRSKLSNAQGRFNQGYNQRQLSGLRAEGRTGASKRLAALSEAAGRSGLGPIGASAPGGGGGGGKSGGGRGKSAETLRNEAERELQRAADNLRQFTDDLARSQADLAGVTAELSRDMGKRAAAEKQQIEAERASRQRAIEADAELDDAKKQQLLLLNEQEAAGRKALVDQRLRDDLARENSRIAQDRSDLEIELLSFSRDLARTASERREVELRILDLAFEAEKARLEEIKATNAATSAAYKYAEARLSAMPGLQSGAAAVVRDRTQGPMESYLSGIPRSADESREALERVQVDGIDGIIDGLAQAAVGARSLGDVFKSVANQIIADLIRISLQKALVGGLSGVLGGLFGGGRSSTSKAFDAAFSGDAFKLPKFAKGGAFTVGGMSGIDTNILSVNGNPMARVSQGERVSVSPSNDNGGVVRVVLEDTTGLFVTRVEQVSGNVVGAATPHLVRAGGQAGLAAVRKMQSRSL